jgi:hypothetical protein
VLPVDRAAQAGERRVDADAGGVVALGEGDPRVGGDRDQRSGARGVVEGGGGDHQECGACAQGGAQQRLARARCSRRQPAGVDRHQQQRGRKGQGEQPQPRRHAKGVEGWEARRLGEPRPVPPEQGHQQELERRREHARGEQGRLGQQQEEAGRHQAHALAEADPGRGAYQGAGGEVQGELQRVEGDDATTQPAQRSQQVRVERGDQEGRVREPAAGRHLAGPAPVELAIGVGNPREGILGQVLAEQQRAHRRRHGAERRQLPGEASFSRHRWCPQKRPGSPVDSSERGETT